MGEEVKYRDGKILGASSRMGRGFEGEGKGVDGVGEDIAD